MGSTSVMKPFAISGTGLALSSPKKYTRNGSTQHPERPLFTSQKGGEFTAQGIVMLLGSVYHEAGITGANFHSARVSFASRLAVRGISVFVLRQLMSHEDISTNSGYVTTGDHLLTNALKLL